jgi:multidrug efflux system membrane fusion protein
MKMKRRFPIGLALAVAAAGCGSRTEAKAPVRPVRVESLRTEVEGRGVRYSASIQPAEQVPLAFKVGGYVQELRQRSDGEGRSRTLQQGDEVVRGAQLARLNQADYRERVNQARGQWAVASASMERARTDGARAERLYAERSLTRPEYDAARAGLAMAEARAQAARAQLESAEIALRDTALIAPLDGVVMARQIEVGSLAAPGSVGFVVADLTHVKAVFGVPDRLVERARVGLPLTVTCDAFGEAAFPGRISAVAPSADPQSRVFSVEVTIANPRRQLKPGMIATVEVPAPGGEAGVGQLTVALAAIVKAGKTSDGYAVFVVEGSEEKAIARAVPVALGPIAGNRVSVAGGLKPGQRVIVTGASLLRDGEPVRVIPGAEEN